MTVDPRVARMLLDAWTAVQRASYTGPARPAVLEALGKIEEACEIVGMPLQVRPAGMVPCKPCNGTGWREPK